MKTLSHLLLAGILLLYGYGAPAQDEYIVGERDTLDIQVWGEPSMSTTVVISSQETITYWMLGEIDVSGKSVSEIKNMLTQTLEENYLKNPVVDVRVSQFRSKEINIQGAVRNPGSFTLETNSISLLKLLSVAGGTSEDVGSQAYILRDAANKLKEETGEKDIVKMEDRIEIDLVKLLRQGNLSEDKTIYGGDFIFVASKDFENINIYFIWVEGEVKNPGQLNFQEGLTALQACIHVGGFTDLAAPKRARLSRMGPDGIVQVTKVNLKAVSKGKKPDVLLQPGDRIKVPERIF